MKQNLIIRASAGTGKTFSLATRFIQLMLFENVAPSHVVALTFSRAAAREIYVKLLERLWCAAASEDGARREEALLKKGLSAGDLATLERKRVAFTPLRFATLLRETIDVQSVGAIATLDSFILRIVRSFPLEMGFQHAVEVLDDFGEKNAVRAVGDALLSTDRPECRGELSAAFKTAQHGQFKRACQLAFEKVLSQWHGFLSDHPEAREWTAESMGAALGIDMDAARPSVAGLAAAGNNAAYFEKFCSHLMAFDGTGEIFPDTKLGEMMLYFEANSEATVWAYDTEGKRPQHKVCDCGADGAAAVRAGIRWMVSATLRRQLQIVAAKLRICALFEGDYDRTTRRQGKLTFADFTRCQAFAEGSDRALQLQDVQYRFDERFSHWALDEFQDTSKLQWQCLKRLVREAAGGEGRSVMVVGDLKQSIYGWRGGDDGPFREVMEDWGEFRGDWGESVRNDTSYRYGLHTANFVNRVFGPENLRNPDLLNGRCAKAVDYWLGENCWMTHKPDMDSAGRPKDGDYVEIVRVGKDANAVDGFDAGASGDDDEGGDAKCSAAMKILAPKICALVKELWSRHEKRPDGASTDTIGILVRNNGDGSYLAERLRGVADADIPVVWEGANGILDTPAVQAVLEFVRLAAHPEDEYAWQAVRLLPVRRLVLPALETREEVAQELATQLSRLGLARMLRDIVGRLTAPEAGLSSRSRECLETLVRLAVAFEQREDGGADLEAFPRFLSVAAGRESGDSPRVVRILTIHRSKGLTLDHVIVPVLESGTKEVVGRPDPRSTLTGEGWVLEMPARDLAQRNAVLSAAWQAKADERLMELLRLNYVALTRARKSTYVFVVDEKHAPAVQFRDLLLAPFAGGGAQAPEMREYGEVVFAEGTPFRFERRERSETAVAPWQHAAGTADVRRITPSAAGSAVALTRGVKSMSAFFTREFGEAAQRGIDAHAAYAAIEWIDPDGAQSPDAPLSELERKILSSEFREAFVKPAPDATVWRERSYELYQSFAWETGQFDRVVFTGEGENRSAVIYDFKTNGRHDGESDAAFAERMVNLYGAQMATYRQALRRLTKIPLERIETRLLLEATGQSILT